jgi:SpoVK/Ycf46/Vps4 family AAA+-type ATPase
VLPPEVLAQLTDLCEQIRHEHRVYEDWGFGSKVSRGRGVGALFSGPPGTGKTLAAEVIAGELKLELYKVDLARVVSKYVGETEKNLSRIFAEAEDGNAILFFDEADALFGKRTEISDAHDRYANIETSYLLQRMEEYAGVVVLASNLRENMDDAFLRRIRFLVDFPFPDAAGRLRIWRSHLPDEAPVSEDIDFQVLAERVQVAGGNIRNIVLNAAFFAAADGGEEIEPGHVLKGVRREYEKIGKRWDEGLLTGGKR